MSFILDALKKSENERQRQIGPSLADVQVRRRQGEKPWWAVAVAALLVINLGVLLVVLARDGKANPPDPQPVVAAPSPQPAPSSPGSPPPAQTPPASTDPAVRSLADEAGALDATPAGELQNPGFAAAAVVPEGPPMVRPIEAPVAPLDSRPVFESRSARSESETVRQSNEVLPTLSDLTASGTSLPELHLDIHVHSANPAERFVFVNMHKYTEGQALSEGPVVERITPEGVVLNHQGLRFLLPRQ